MGSNPILGALFLEISGSVFLVQVRGRFFSYIFGVSGKIFCEIFRLRVSVITVFRKKVGQEKKL